ncbi:MAG: glycosyltransferase family 39 protein [Planctomycetes bacterium]|nr:glycosyltransferase family 39 protein [Planctomycetota bacterium]
MNQPLSQTAPRLFGSYQPVPRTAWIVLAVVTAAAAVLRFYHLGHESFWLDEFFTLDIAREPSAAAVWSRMHEELQPPLYFILAHFSVALCGADEFALRLPSALGGILTVPLVFLVAQRLYTHREGLLAAGFTAILLQPIAYSQEARNYALVVMLTLAATACWLPLMEGLFAAKRLRPGPAIGYALLAAASCYTHYFGLLLIGCQCGFACLYACLKRARLATVLLLYGLVLLAYLPWLPSFLHHFGRSKDFEDSFLKRPKLEDLEKFYRFLFNDTRYLLAFALLLYLALLFIALKSARAAAPKSADAASPAPGGSGGNTSWLRRFLDAPGLLLAFWLAAPVALMWVKSQFGVPLFVFRYLLIVMPAAYILLARALCRLPLPAARQYLYAAALGLVMLWHLFCVRAYYGAAQKAQVRDAAAYIAAHEPRLDSAARAPALLAYMSADTRMLDYYLERAGSPLRVDLAAFTDDDLPAVRAFLEARKPKRLWVLFAYPGRPGPRMMEFLRERLRATGCQTWSEAKVKTQLWRFEAREKE